jgi:hypothetical protein
MGIFTWLAVKETTGAVKKHGLRQEKLLGEMVEIQRRRERREIADAKPDRHQHWLANLRLAVPIEHPDVDERWRAELSQGFGDHSVHFSMAAKQIRAELTDAGYDVDELMRDLNRA